MARSADEVLVVGEDSQLNEAVVEALRRATYRARGVRGLKRGLAEARTAPEVLVVDVGPSMAEVAPTLRDLKNAAKTRAMLMVVLADKADELETLELGVDDFLAKPCSVRVLVARVRALLRVHRGLLREDEEGLPTTRLTFPGVVIDGARHEVTVDGVPVTFTATEFRLLHFLASNEGRVFSRHRLLSEIVGEFNAVIDRNVDVHVGVIRKKLGARRGLLQTIRGVGYRVVGEGAVSGAN